MERPAKSSSWCKGHENVFPTMGLVVKYLYLHTVWWKNCQVIPCETTHPAVGNSKLQSNYELWPVVRAWLVPLPNVDGVIKQITVKTREMDVKRTHFDVSGPWKPWKVPHKKKITVKMREMDVKIPHFDVNGPWKPWKLKSVVFNNFLGGQISKSGVSEASLMHHHLS